MFPEMGNLLQSLAGFALHGLMCIESIMGRENHIQAFCQFQHGLDGGIVRRLIRPERHSLNAFVVVNIQSGAGQDSIIEGSKNIRWRRHLTAGNIDEEGAFFEHPEPVTVEVAGVG